MRTASLRGARHSPGLDDSNKTVYVALGVNLDGHKELLGLWIAQNEGAKFWLAVLTELRQRGLEDLRLTVTNSKVAPAVPLYPFEPSLTDHATP